MFWRRLFLVMLIGLAVSTTNGWARRVWKVEQIEIKDYERGYPFDDLFFVFWTLEAQDDATQIEVISVYKYIFKDIQAGDYVEIIWDRQPVDWHRIFVYDPRFLDENKHRWFANVAKLRKVEKP